MSEALHRILLIDDDELIAELATMSLQAAGLMVRYCSSGQQALEQVADFQPQLILLDALMPEMDGKATYRALRTIPAAAQVPILFLTGKTAQHHQDEFLAMGALGVMAKPFDAGRLFEHINAHWQQRSVS